MNRRILLFALLCACSSKPAPPALHLTGYPAARAAIEEETTVTQHLYAGQSNSWMRLADLADVYQRRARLTGDWADYGRADEALIRAFTIAPKGSGPFEARARLSFTLHRLPGVGPDVDAAESYRLLAPEARDGLEALKADVALERGGYDEALAVYQKLAAKRSDGGVLARLARHAWVTGDLDRADEYYRQALALAQGDEQAQSRAYLSLLRGLVAFGSGRWDDALARYAEADREFPGWWLIREHQTEIHALQGKKAEAVASYRQLALETSDPEYMDALARLLPETESVTWSARAKAIHDQRLARFPEAAYGHALEHYLSFEDPARAVELAEKNRDLRPGGEAWVKLARAYTKAGRLADARAAVEHVLASKYRSTELHAVAAIVYGALGDAFHSEEQRAAALAIDPHAPFGYPVG